MIKLGLVEFFAGQDAAVAAALEHVDHHVVGVGIQLLDLLALHVGLAGIPEQVGEARLAHARVDDPNGERQVIEQRGEFTGCAGRRTHACKHVLAKCGSHNRGRRHPNRIDAIIHGGPFMARCEAQSKRQERNADMSAAILGARSVRSPRNEG
jgi:hypothetical protein